MYLLLKLFIPLCIIYSGYPNNKDYLSVTRDKGIRGNHVVHLEPEKEKIIRNPMMGWALYADAYHPDMKFWQKFDHISVQGHASPVKASDYATHLYIRWPWSALEKEEGAYAWEYDEFFLLLERGAEERGLKLAFRVYVDSRDYRTSSTPEYVRMAGAKGYMGNTGKWSPYPDDPVFQEKFEKFIRAFAERYDDPGRVEFVDGFGLGKWGEGHSIELTDKGNYIPMFHWITHLYLTSFKKIPVAINYHVEIGKPLLTEAFEQGYILRHDAFGMSQYYGDFEKSIVQEQFPRRPVIAESGWWMNGNENWYQRDPNGYKTWQDVWGQTLQDALNEHANILDLRNIAETRSWMEHSLDLVNRFIAEGGYRLYPDHISLPATMKNNTTISIIHRWNNLGVGVCPSNIKQWNQKYQVAFALLDQNTQTPQKIFIDPNAEPSQWIKNKPVTYKHRQEIKDIPEGIYTWGIAIVDTSQNNTKGINISVKRNTGPTGWVPLFDVTVK
ncbi:MAG: DUF4832 domain-containing protein [Bacteroidales bacterium]|jgi:hypothetical protein|nr:DUF4832 domain-containing protein [Bacteroidales bacterium]